MPATAARILDALPQTQCTRCGYPDCAGYAQAIAEGSAGILQCPPGGDEGIARLSALTGRPIASLDPAFGIAGPRTMAVIDEAWCIGCTLCLDACPTDAITGIHKRMHTVIEAHCTGCELCIPACPVDCISLEVATPGRSGWQAWSQGEADHARARYKARRARIAQDAAGSTAGANVAATTTADAGGGAASDASTSGGAEPASAPERRRAIVEAAMARARAATAKAAQDKPTDKATHKP